MMLNVCIWWENRGAGVRVSWRSDVICELGTTINRGKLGPRGEPSLIFLFHSWPKRRFSKSQDVDVLERKA